MVRLPKGRTMTSLDNLVRQRKARRVSRDKSHGYFVEKSPTAVARQA